jgi:hypothetical protein
MAGGREVGMNLALKAKGEMVKHYFHLFVNRRAYVVQSVRPHQESGHYYYYRPKAKDTNKPICLTEDTIRRHLEGDLELWGEDRSRAGSVLPCFYSRSGEPLVIPESFVPGVKAAVRGVACVGCSHSHFLVPRQAPVEVAGGSG